MKKKLLLLLLIVGTSIITYSQELPQLFLGDDLREIQIDTESHPEFFRNALRVREVELNPVFQQEGVLKVGDRFSLNLFGDVLKSARIEKTSTNINDTYSILARIEGSVFGYVIIATTNERTLCWVELPEANQKFKITRNPQTNIRYVIELDALKTQIDELIHREEPPPPPQEGLIEWSAEEIERIQEASTADPNALAVIDLMVLYTPFAELIADFAHEGIENAIGVAMVKAQMVLDNSETNAQLNLVHLAEVNYEESGSLSQDLSNLASSKNPMKEIHNWRDDVGADLVSLIVGNPDGGVAYSLRDVNPLPDGSQIPNNLPKPYMAFSVTQIDLAVDHIVFIHELGHNLGAGHHKLQSHQPGRGLFDYSAGWRWLGADNVHYLSVMSYDIAWANDYAPLFSNPNINYMGVPAGYYTEPGDTLNSYNARTIRKTKHIVAAYKTPPKIIYVSEEGSNWNTGGSWNRPKRTIENALSWIRNLMDHHFYDGETYQIWVKSGTYYPTYSYTITANYRRRHLRMHNNIEIYGGFAGHESKLEERNISANPTIISGDRNQSGDTSGNVYHVFYHPSSLGLDHTAVLDGFIIRDGYADGNMAWPNPYNSDFAKGAGMKNEPGNNPTIRNVRFENNQAEEYGGGMFNDNANPLLINVEFINNKADFGGGLYNTNNSQPVLINNTFYNNIATTAGPAISNYFSSLQLTNSIVWNNASPSSGQIFNVTSPDVEVTHSIVTGGYDGYGNIDADPQFVNPVAGNLDLQDTSPAIEAGDNMPYQPGNPAHNVHVDINGNPRIKGIHVDMGARENQVEQDIPFSVRITSVDASMKRHVYANVVIELDGERFGYMDKSNFTVLEDGNVKNWYQVIPPMQGGGVRRADIVFIMDNSGSMSPYQNSVAANVNDFVNSLVDSGVDFALGLTRFGQSSNSGNPIIENEGQLTSDPNYFLNELWSLNVASGGREPGYYAIVQSANGFSFRPGAQKIFIILTDETPNQGGATMNEALNACVNNTIALHAVTKPSLYSTFSAITEATNGGLYDFNADYSGVLQSISGAIGYSYTVYYDTENDSCGDDRNLEIIVSYGGNQDSAEITYTPCDYQEIRPKPSTVSLHESPLEAGVALNLEMEITDYVEPYTQNVTVYYRNPNQTNFTAVPMTISTREGISSNWVVTIPGSAVQTPGLDYYVSASDGNQTSSYPMVEPMQNPVQLAVMPNEAPLIVHNPIAQFVPEQSIEIMAEVTDETDYLETVSLFYRQTGQLIYEQTIMQATVIDRSAPPDDDFGVEVYIAEIPAYVATEWGVEYYIEARDNYNVKGYMILDGTLVSADNPIYLLPGSCPPPINFQAQLLANNQTVSLNWQKPHTSKDEPIESIVLAHPESEYPDQSNITEIHIDLKSAKLALKHTGSNPLQTPTFFKDDEEQIMLHYDGPNYNAVGLQSGGTMYPAVRFPANMLAQYQGHRLEDILIYISELPAGATEVLAWNAGTPSTPGSLVHQQSFVPNSESWMIVGLNNNVILDGNDLWVGYKVTHAGNQYPAGIDAGTAHPDGNWTSTDGINWEKLTDYDIDYNWNIRARLSATQFSPEPIAYKIYRNNVFIANVPATTFSYIDNPGTGVFNYGVSAVYDHCESVPAGPVQITIDTTCQPDWTVVPNLQFNMQVTAQILIDGVASTNPNDVIGAFVGSECRGMASPDPSQTGLVFLTIGSDLQSGETVNLVIWNSEECETCQTSQTLEFINLTQIGTPGSPLIVECTGDVNLELSFGQGFTWFSINVNPGSMNPNNLFSDLTPCVNDRIIGQTSFATFFNGNWIGSITNLNSNQSYVMELCSEQSVIISGSPATIDPISLNAGFTWLGYLPQSTLPINTALAMVSPPPGINDRLIGQTSFATFFNNQWIGSLTQMNPGDGYVIDLSNAVSLLYPTGGAKQGDTFSELQKPLISPTGKYPAENMQHNMTVIAQLITHDGRQALNQNDIVYAYVGDECRGIANVTELNGTLFLTIGSNLQAGETVTFKVWLDEVKELFEIRESLSFEAFRAMGTMDNPFTLTLDAPLGEGFAGHQNWHIGDPYPNPFTGSTQIPYQVGGDSEVSIKVFNSIGQVVFSFTDTHEQAGDHQLTFERGSLPSGVYQFRMEISANQNSRVKTGRVVIM